MMRRLPEQPGIGGGRIEAVVEVAVINRYIATEMHDVTSVRTLQLDAVVADAAQQGIWIGGCGR